MTFSHTQMDIRQWSETEFKTKDDQTLFDTIAANKEKIQHQIKHCPEFKNNFQLLLENLIPSTIQKDKKSEEHVKLLCANLRKIHYVYEVYPALGKKVITFAATYYDQFHELRKKPLASQFSSLIRFILNSCPHVSIPLANKLVELVCCGPEPLKIKSQKTYLQLQAIFNDRAENLAITTRKDGFIRNKLQMKIDSHSRNLHVIKPYFLNHEQKADPKIQSPFVLLWLELQKRLALDIQKDKLKTETIEFLVTLREISQAILNNQIEEAIHLTLAGIKINSASSLKLGPRVRGTLLTYLILPFTSFANKLTSDQMIFTEYFHCEVAPAYYEIGEYLQTQFKKFQDYLTQNKDNENRFAEFLKDKPITKELKTPYATFKKAPKNYSVSLFGLNEAVRSVRWVLDSDPEMTLYPAEFN